MPERLELAFVLPDDAPPRRVSWDDVQAWRPGGPLLWAHLDRRAAGTREFLEQTVRQRSIVETLVAAGSRPRVESTDEGHLVSLRGVNLNEGAEPEDMVSLRSWLEPRRLLTVGDQQLRTIADVAAMLDGGRSLPSTSALLVEIAATLSRRVVPVIEQVAETLDDLEDAVIDPDRTIDRAELVVLRRRIIALHRYLAPQADALADLLESDALPTDPERRAITAAMERTRRVAEDLDAARGRAIVVQDELANQLAQTLNRRMYVVTVLAALFLPLTFATGLLGMNVGGIPGSSHPAGFVATIALLAVGAALGWWIARRADWL